jgi:hypothetical protein
MAEAGAAPLSLALFDKKQRHSCLQQGQHHDAAVRRGIPHGATFVHAGVGSWTPRHILATEVPMQARWCGFLDVPHYIRAQCAVLCGFSTRKDAYAF